VREPARRSAAEHEGHLRREVVARRLHARRREGRRGAAPGGEDARDRGGRRAVGAARRTVPAHSPIAFSTTRFFRRPSNSK
jgi:hypothetical protein